MSRTVKTLFASVIALTLSVPAFAEDGDILDSAREDARALGPEPESHALDVDELVAADRARSADNKPLQLRKTQPLALSTEAPSDGLWWKLLLSVGIIGGAIFLLRRKFTAHVPVVAPTLDVLCRKSVGVRSEICVICVDGQRILLGVTPSNIQRLAMLPDLDEPMTLAELDREMEAPADPGFDDLVDATYARLMAKVEDEQAGHRQTVVASTDAMVPEPASSNPRVIVRDAPASAPPSSIPARRAVRPPKNIDTNDFAGAQAASLRALRRRAG